MNNLATLERLASLLAAADGAAGDCGAFNIPTNKSYQKNQFEPEHKFTFESTKQDF